MCALSEPVALTHDAGSVISVLGPGCAHDSAISSSGGGPDLLVHRYWSDTVWVPAGARVVIRLRFRNFPGRSFFHCHILPHEDIGMMGIYEVV